MVMANDPATVLRVLHETRQGICEACLEVLTGLIRERLRDATDVLVDGAKIAIGRATCASCKMGGPTIIRLRS